MDRGGRNMVNGQLVGEVDRLDAPPVDTVKPSVAAGGLTITIGYGPSLFDGRFGLGSRKPELLGDLPALPQREPRPQLHRWRPVHPGLLR